MSSSAIGECVCARPLPTQKDYTLVSGWQVLRDEYRAWSAYIDDELRLVALLSPRARSFDAASEVL
jgi:hypothetical protein